MSLLFERAIREFSPDRARHVERDTDESATGAPEGRINLDHLATLASNRHHELAHTERDEWTCVPLHERDSADLSEEYVVFERHPIRGDVFVYRDSETGDADPLDFEAASETTIARRLRFWLPDYDPDEWPSYAREGPRTRVSPPTSAPGARHHFVLTGCQLEFETFLVERHRIEVRRPGGFRWTIVPSESLPAIPVL